MAKRTAPRSAAPAPGPAKPGAAKSSSRRRKNVPRPAPADKPAPRAGSSPRSGPVSRAKAVTAQPTSTAAPPSITFTTTIMGDMDGTAMSGIQLPFDPKALFGSARAPVRVTLNGYTYRSTTFIMDGCRFVPLRTSNREAAGVRDGQTLEVTMTLDTAERTVEVPPDLDRTLRAAGLRAAFDAMSYTCRREYVEAIAQAKKPETREKRVGLCVQECRRRAAR